MPATSTTHQGHDEGVHLEPHPPGPLRLLGALALMTLAMAVTTWFGRRAVLGGERIRTWDDRLSDAATDWTWRHQAMIDPLVVWQEISQPWVLYLVLTLLALLLHRTGRVRRRALWVVPIALVAWALSALGKLVVERPRPTPPDPITLAHGFSYPSGHATGSTIAMILLVVLLWPAVRHGWLRALLVLAAATLVVLTCLDRVLLGVHFPSDVIAGVLVGTAMTTAALLLVLRRAPGRVRDPQSSRA